jgi:predicted ATPase
MSVGRLLERDASIGVLDGLLAEAKGARGRLVLLGAEAGGGKTTLVQHFCQRVGSSTRVLVGACDPLSTPRPLGPLIDIAAAAGGRLAQTLLDARPRAEVFGAVLDQLTSLPGPTVIVFEDIHWADEATLDLLRFLGRRLGATRALLIATYREDELSPTHPVRVMMGDLATTAVRRLSLAPLSEQAVEQLAEGSALDAGFLYRLTGGNPFFLTEVLAVGGRGVPPTVRDAVLARVARLSAAARATLEAAAIIGSRIEPTILAAVAGPDPEAVDECLAAGMLRPEQNLLTFRHELSREAVLGTLPPHRSMFWHGCERPRPGRTTSPGWPTMPRPPATGRQSRSLRPPRPAGR